MSRRLILEQINTAGGSVLVETPGSQAWFFGEGGEDCESYHGAYPTREDAIEAVRKDLATIGEAPTTYAIGTGTAVNVGSFFQDQVGDWLDDAMQQHFVELSWMEESIKDHYELSKEQELDLGRRLREAFNEWLISNNFELPYIVECSEVIRVDDAGRLSTDIPKLDVVEGDDDPTSEDARAAIARRHGDGS